MFYVVDRNFVRIGGFGARPEFYQKLSGQRTSTRKLRRGAVS
jgi:hypothetical protein